MDTLSAHFQYDADTRSVGRPDGCKFCKIKDLEDVIYGDATAVVVPSIGAFVEGWLLVVPQRHVLSLSELSSDEWVGFAAIAARAEASLIDHYGPVVRFEHGSSASGGAAGCGVDHAHLHLVPGGLNLRCAIASVRDDVGTFRWVECDDQPPQIPSLDYIYISDSTGSWISHSEFVPSQVVRRAMARELNVREWDWKRSERRSMATRTLARLKPA